MKKSFLTSLCALCTLFLVQAADYTIEPTTAIKSNTIPYFRNSNGMKGSVTQQIYLPSEFAPSGASAGNITDITFYYASKDGSVYSPNTANACTRQIEIYLMETSVNSYTLEYVDNTWKSKFLCNGSNKAGTKVYDGNLTTNEVTYIDPQQSVTLHLDAPFAWDGVSNIVLTLYDKSSTPISENTYNNLKFYITETSHARFVHWRWLSGSDDDRSAWISNINRYGDTYGNPSVKDSAGYANKRNFVPKTTFSISTTIPAPTNLAASSITTSSATLSWDAAAGATGYNVRWGKTSGSLDHSQNNVAATSLDISDLDDGETYYFDVQTITAGGTSAWASEANFNTTAITHEHDGISFDKWASTTSMPTSGDYYLANNVALDPYEPSTITLTGNLNLCLNGKTANIYGSKIVVPSGKTITIYDNEDGGLLTGFVASEVGISEDLVSSLIVVKGGGTLVLKQGTIENTYVRDEDGASYAIYSNGTVRISGNVLINSNDADIYLYSTNVITLDAAISNAEKHTVYISGGTFTSGWSTYMSGEDPRDYFESANSARSVCLSEGEAAMRLLLQLSEESLNSSISTSYGKVADVELTRTLTSAQYNTFCLPFALDDDQLQAFFGSGYDLEALISTSLEEEILTLTFERKYALEAGKPYLLQPTSNVSELFFIGVTITANAPVNVVTTYADFKPVYGTTTLEDGNSNILFLGENNTLFWPELSTGNMKAFRAYFELKDVPANVQARIGRAESQTTAIENQKSHIDNHKYMKDGQLLIERNGVIYNAQGQTIK